MQSAENEESVYRASKKTEVANATNVGGQAVLEGVMMRAPGALTIVCRRRSNGELVVRERTIPTVTSGPLTWPLIRGAGVLVSSLKIGQQALRWSADIMEKDFDALERKEAAMKDGKLASPSEREDEKAAKVAKAEIASPPTLSVMSPFTHAMSALTQMVVSIVSTTGTETPAPSDGAEEPKSGMSRVLAVVPILFAIGLFVAAPQAVAEGVNAIFKLGLEVTSPGYQVITGVAKLCIVIGYMALLRLNSDIRRVFQYHGAEHKAISTLEAGHDLTVEAARPTSPLHARCGTTFLVMVAMVSVVLFSAVGAFLPPLPGGRLVQGIGFFLMKLPLLPVVAGITYEIQRFMAKYCTTGPLQVLIWPGFLVQKITTAPPDDDQLEVALASLRTALARAAEKAPAAAQPADKTYESYGALSDAVPVDRAHAPLAA
jgi:uncharacterized protein YqhQ